MKKKNKRKSLVSQRILRVGLFVFLLLFLSSNLGAKSFIKSLTLQNADIHSVLSFLADYGDVNIVTSPSVKANVTLNLKNVTWKQALDIVLKTYSLAGVDEPGYIRVLPLKEYMEEQSVKQRHLAEQKGLISLKTEIISVKNAAADELIKPVKTVLSSRGLVDVDKRTNSLIITDTPEDIAKAKSLVENLDRETDQIKISTQLLEIETKALQELGIDWTFLTSEERGTAENPITHDIQIDQLADRVSDPFGVFTYSTVQEKFELDGVISALMRDNKARVLARPEITTMDNKEAVIQMGQKIPIKQFDPSGNVVITFVEVGTILRVTPHITAENRILMHLMPERSSYSFDPNGVIISTNNAETNVVVENGQPAIIGGLVSEEKKESNTGIPILKDIPLLGYFFRYTINELSKRELVIVVTPTIVTEEGKGLGLVEPEDFEKNP